VLYYQQIIIALRSIIRLEWITVKVLDEGMGREDAQVGEGEGVKTVEGVIRTRKR